MLIRILILSVMQITAFGIIKIDYQQAVMRALQFGRKAYVLNEQSKISEYSLDAARKSIMPIYNLSSTLNSDSSKSAGVSANQSFASGAKANLNYNAIQNNPSLEFSQPLLKGFNQTMRTLANSEDAFLQARISQTKTIQNIIEEVLGAYWQALKASKNKQMQIIAKKSAEKLYQQYQIKVKMGLLPKLSLSEQESQMKRFTLQEIQQQTEEIKSKETIKLLLNYSRAAKIQLTGPVELNVFGELHSFNTIKNQLLANNLEIKNAKINLRIAKRNYENAKNSALPSVNLSAKIDKNSGASLGLEFAVPINDPVLKQQILAANSALMQAELNLEQITQDKIRTAKNYWQDLTSKKKENSILRANLKISKNLLEMTKKQNKYGKASSLDITIRQKTYVTDQQNLLSNKIDYLRLYVKLLAEQGTLTRKFGVVV